MIVLLPSLLVSSAATVDAQSTRPFLEETLTLESRRVVVPAPAVAETLDGELVGVSSTLEVTIRNGSGAVYVDTRPFTQLDMQGSARLAAAMAAGITGRALEEHDYFVAMRAGSAVVGGPSAGGIMTVAFVALLLDVPIRDDVAMTGMINPDGTIGPVGGILQKAEASANAGANLFLIPEGQSLVTRLSADGSTMETVDVREHAAQAWGLEVREVLDVQEAIEAFTDIVFERQQHGTPQPRAEVVEVLDREAQARVTAARTELERLRGEVQDEPQGVSPTLRQQLEDTLDTAETTLDRATLARERGTAYTAASLVFQTRIQLRQVDIILRTAASEDQGAFLTNHSTAVRDEAMGLVDELADVAPETISELESLGAAQVRVVEALSLVADTTAALQRGRTFEAISSLAYAEERLGSVREWQGLAESFRAMDEEARVTVEPSALATEVHSAAEQSFAYAASLLGQGVQDGGTSAYLVEAQDALEEAREAFRLGLPLAGMYRALDGQTAAHAALSLVGAPNLLDDRVARQAQRAGREIGSVRELGGEPVLAVSLFEFADSLDADDPRNALLLYGSAATVARLSAALSGASGCAFGGLACSPTAMPRILPDYHIDDPWTGYFALAATLLGFVAGMLITMVVQRQPPKTEDGSASAGTSMSGRATPTATPALRIPRHGASRRRTMVSTPPSVMPGNGFVDEAEPSRRRGRPALAPAPILRR